MTTFIIIVAISLVALVVLTTIYRLFRLNQHQTKTIAQLQGQLSTLHNSAIDPTTKERQFEQRLNQLKGQQSAMDLSSNSQRTNYDDAMSQLLNSNKPK